MASAKGQLRQEQEQRLQQRINVHNVMLGRMLEMTAPQWDDEVRRQLDDNPALEIADDTTADTPENDYGETADQLQMADYADADDIPHYRLEADNGTPETYHIDTADDDESMYEVLMRRLAAESNLDPAALRSAAYIVGNIDNNGYMTRSLADIADDIAIAEGIEPSPQTMNEAFAAVRALDPAGIGAVDLRDCLLLQLERRQPTADIDLAVDIVKNHFDLFSKKHYDRLISATGADSARVRRAIDIILSLNPRPAASIADSGSADRARHVTPDFVLDYDPADDTFRLSSTATGLNLTIDPAFDAGAGSQGEAATFVRRKRDEASAFIHLARLRAETLDTIASAVVAWQHDFFVGGDRSLIRPMVLRDISRRTGLDISVISRAVAGKYILTPYGVYPLKFFFNEYPRDNDGVTSHQLEEEIKELIDNEDKKSPMSDNDIMAALRARGHDVARRTVAKYRERMGYPVARLRKTY